MVEATDVDYLKQDNLYNITKNPQTLSSTFVDLNKIVDEINATPLFQSLKKEKNIENEKDHATCELQQDKDTEESEQEQRPETDYNPKNEIKIEEAMQNENRKGKRKLYHDNHNEFNQEYDINYDPKEK
ncbi:1970_t:CDS:1 [Gigaspora rosea]|nr:1970_t:CDS:1 [Gigaspora rosea]